MNNEKEDSGLQNLFSNEPKLACYTCSKDLSKRKKIVVDSEGNLYCNKECFGDAIVSAITEEIISCGVCHAELISCDNDGCYHCFDDNQEIICDSITGRHYCSMKCMEEDQGMEEMDLAEYLREDDDNEQETNSGS